MDCVFCKIAKGEIPAQTVYQDAELVAFSDLEPQAPVHLLLIPREHIESLAEANVENSDLMAKLMVAAARIAKEQCLDSGWRLVTNCGEDAGQSVPHLHFHLLGGRKLTWPPG